MGEADGGELTLARLRRTAPLLAVLLLLVAGVLGWNGMRQWRDGDVRARVEQVRDQVVAATTQALAAQRRQLDTRLQDTAVQAALAQGEAEAAAAAIARGWAAAEQVQVRPAELADAYAQAGEFGYARLGLMEAALLQDRTLARVVRDGGGVRLGVAAPAMLGEVPALVYARLPLSLLAAPVQQAQVPAGTYLALRQGGYTVVQKGDSGLAGGGEAMGRALGDTGLRVAMAVPDTAAGPLGLGAIACLVLAGILGVAAIAVLLYGRGLLRLRGSRMPQAQADSEPTLQQSLERMPSPVSAAPAAAPEQPRHRVAEGIFRAYDIRGVVGSDLVPATATLIGQAIGSAMQAQGLRDVVVGRDGRLSSPALAAALVEGLLAAGCRVIDIGMVPTPVVYFASEHLGAGSCVAVTGSHNPPDHNGFKVVIGGQALCGDAIGDLYRRIDEGRLHVAAEPGALEQRDVGDDYVQRIANDVQLERPLKVVADAGNGVAGEIAPRLLEAIGAEVIPLYCDVDGSFPNHHPDPSEPHNLEDLAQTVKRFDADVGVAFDGDGDRLGVVTGEGEVIFPDRLLMLFAADVLQRNPGALVIYDVKCTGKLSDCVLRNGGSPLIWKSGHSPMKAKMRETDAELGGEMSGHFFFRERWYGFDDGLYAAARLLEILAQREEPPSAVLAELPRTVATPEIKQALAGSPHAVAEAFVASLQGEDSRFAAARLTTIDGVRADFADGWGLLRASNTTPVLVLRFEGDDEQALERIRQLFREQLRQVAPEIELAF
ncbi:phosphomannomutase/phosphoglucomutase [Stenotrophomonas sp. MMGLT7]|uniref:phosphomannomutase/phosphoglucomutase n=1 Tax=Stenotrophomonas sp. MMGLT7 TaxID=2901227 RepID=UPI001E3B3966|nr:phosphomannomutase/phosphoglucomutase [Stenotrophomonas sp. MMGLT7]MCD7098409.1 phosphomannomutase/phosphoglucomutase [Stenotrophomonas sp. MMGLT7]